MPTLYDTLGVGKDAGEPEIKRAYRSKAKALHPDNKVTGDEVKFHALTVAYDTLKDKQSRAHYDATGKTSDGRKTNPVEDKARELIGMIMADFINQPDILAADLVGMLYDGIKDAKKVIAEGRALLAKTETKLKRLKKVRKKLRAKNAGLIGEILDANVKMLEDKLLILTGEVQEGDQALKRAKQIIDDGEYAYDPDLPDPEIKKPVPSFGNLSLGEILEGLSRRK